MQTWRYVVNTMSMTLVISASRWFS